MSPETFLTQILNEGLNFLSSIGGPSPTDDVRRFLLCVALQESGPKLDARYQGSPSSVPGPARGFWQFEQGGGVTGVLHHPASKTLAEHVCSRLTIAANPAAVWRALEGNDLLSCSFARLLLLTDANPIPTTEDTGWTCYCYGLWRPGAPHPDIWRVNWEIATITVQQSHRPASPASEQALGFRLGSRTNSEQSASEPQSDSDTKTLKLARKYSVEALTTLIEKDTDGYVAVVVERAWGEVCETKPGQQPYAILGRQGTPNSVALETKANPSSGRFSRATQAAMISVGFICIVIVGILRQRH